MTIKDSLTIILVVAIVAASVWFFMTKFKSPSSPIVPSNSVSPSASATPTPSQSNSDEPKIDMEKITIQDIKVGTGAEAKKGNKIKVNYLGTLLDGTKFDSSYDRGTPFEFNLGAGEVIQGWDIGVAGMKVGGKRKLVIPPQFGYGDRVAGRIPANSVLVFEVELLGIVK